MGPDYLIDGSRCKLGKYICITVSYPSLFHMYYVGFFKYNIFIPFVSILDRNKLASCLGGAETDDFSSSGPIKTALKRGDYNCVVAIGTSLSGAGVQDWPRTGKGTALYSRFNHFGKQ